MAKSNNNKAARAKNRLKQGNRPPLVLKVRNEPKIIDIAKFEKLTEGKRLYTGIFKTDGARMLVAFKMREELYNLAYSEEGNPYQCSKHDDNTDELRMDELIEDRFIETWIELKLNRDEFTLDEELITSIQLTLEKIIIPAQEELELAERNLICKAKLDDSIAMFEEIKSRFAAELEDNPA